MMKLEKETLDRFFDFILEHFEEYDALALIGERPVTYKETGEAVTKLREKLFDIGIRKGEKIILLGENSPNWCIAYLAITTSGAVAVPVLSEFPESDINHIIRHSEASAVFISDRLHNSLQLSSLDKINGIISLNSFEFLGDDPTKEKKEDKKNKRLRSKIESTPVDIEEDDLAEILYTSGTTGHSKGVMLSHRNIVNNAILSPETVGGVNEDTIVLSLLPLAHAYGCTTAFLGVISKGATVYFLDKKPSPKILMNALREIRPHFLAGVPLVFEKIYHKQVLPQISGKMALRLLTRARVGRKLLYRAIGKKILDSFGGRIRGVIIGGASLNAEVETFLREANIPYVPGYGLSECSPLVTGSVMEDVRFGSVGPAIKGIRIRIVNIDPQSGVGEIQVSGPNVMKGYYKNPAENEKIFTPDGWLATGDRGYLDEDGYLYIKGRSKNVFVGPSGENIYPEVIEDKLRESLFVEESLVYNEDGKMIARVYLDYDHIGRTESDGDISVQDIDGILEKIRRETNNKLPRFSQISKIYAEQQPFEKTPTNKIKRGIYIPGYLKRQSGGSF